MPEGDSLIRSYQSSTLQHGQPIHSHPVSKEHGQSRAAREKLHRAWCLTDRILDPPLSLVQLLDLPTARPPSPQSAVNRPFFLRSICVSRDSQQIPPPCSSPAKGSGSSKSNRMYLDHVHHFRRVANPWTLGHFLIQYSQGGVPAKGSVNQAVGV